MKDILPPRALPHRQIYGNAGISYLRYGFLSCFRRRLRLLTCFWLLVAFGFLFPRGFFVSLGLFVVLGIAVHVFRLLLDLGSAWSVRGELTVLVNDHDRIGT